MEIINEPNIYLNEQETVNLIGTSELLNKMRSSTLPRGALPSPLKT